MTRGLAERCGFKLGLDCSFENVQRLRADEELAVQNERRRAADAEIRSESGLLFDLLGIFFRIEAAVELRRFKSQVPGVALEPGRAESQGSAGAGKELVMVGPEFTLLAGALRSLSRRHGGWAQDRGVTIDESHLGGLKVFLVELGQGRFPEFPAEDALEIGELHERDRRFVASPRRLALSNTGSDLRPRDRLGERFAAGNQRQGEQQDSRHGFIHGAGGMRPTCRERWRPFAVTEFCGGWLAQAAGRRLIGSRRGFRCRFGRALFRGGRRLRFRLLCRAFAFALALCLRGLSSLRRIRSLVFPRVVGDVPTGAFKLKRGTGDELFNFALASGTTAQRLYSNPLRRFKRAALAALIFVDRHCSDPLRIPVENNHQPPHCQRTDFRLRRELSRTILDFSA